MPASDRLPPGLHIVATPIGNLGDLRRARPNAAPRRPHPRRGHARHRQIARAISAPRCRCAATTIIPATPSATRSSRRSANEAVALVSDAGTPLISDPGYKLVRAARAAGHAVHTVPGPSAAIAALTLAGLPTDRFLFLGFLPAKAKARADAIAEIADVRATLVLYESGPRLGRHAGRARRRARRPRGRGRPRDHQAARGMRDRHARRACRALRRCTAEGRDRDRRRPAAGEPPRPAMTQLDAALDEALARLSPSRAAAEVARALERAAQARLRPRARARRNEPPGGREARPRGRDVRLLVPAPARLAHPRPARARAGRRSRHRSPGAAAPSPSSRSRRARATTPRPSRSTNSGCGASRSPPSGSRRATCATATTSASTRSSSSRGRWPRHLANVWQG